MAKIVCYLVANLQCRKWPNIKKTASHTACSALMFIFIRQCTLQNRFLLDLQSGKNVSNTRERERERERKCVFCVEACREGQNHKYNFYLFDTTPKTTQRRLVPFLAHRSTSKLKIVSRNR